MSSDSGIFVPVRVLIAPDKFKGSLSASAAAEAMARGVRSAWPGAESDVAPIADGGEGFAEALHTALGGEWVTVLSVDPIGRQIDGCYAWVEHEKLAVIDMSEASGLWRVAPSDRDPLRANTFGTGLLLTDAFARGARRVLLGLGGSATTDGGVGVARAIGYRFLNGAGDEYDAIPGNLDQLARVERPSDLRLPEIIAACDVQNPLLGERGTARVYSPQKGADARVAELLETAMGRLANICASSLGRDFRDTPGSGAAGGLGFGLLTFCDAAIRPGFDIIAETEHLDARIAAADLVLTGEGRIDDQTLEGKGPAGVAALARKAGKRVIGFAGSVTEEARCAGLFDEIIPISDGLMDVAESMREAAPLLERAVARAARRLGEAR